MNSDLARFLGDAASAADDAAAALARMGDAYAKAQSAHQGNIARIMYLDMKARAEAAETENAALKAKLEEAREVIEPFACEADEYSPERNGGHVFPDHEKAHDLPRLTIGQLRRARCFLEGASNDE